MPQLDSLTDNNPFRASSAVRKAITDRIWLLFENLPAGLPLADKYIRSSDKSITIIVAGPRTRYFEITVSERR